MSDCTVSIRQVVDKLAKYEESAEQNRLLELPVPVGSEVWIIMSGRYPAIVKKEFDLSMIGDWEKSVFPTEEKAEKRSIKSLEGSENMPDMEDEIWKDIPGYDGVLQASTLGNIRELKNGKYTEVKKSLHPDNYYDITQPKDFGTDRPYVARLVAMTFCENDDPDHKKIVDHLNNDHLDNRPGNLEWVTQKENLRRAKALGRSPSGPRKCKCVETGEIFNSIAEASRKFSIRYYSVFGAVESSRPIKGLHFIEVED